MDRHSNQKVLGVQKRLDKGPPQGDTDSKRLPVTHGKVHMAANLTSAPFHHGSRHTSTDGLSDPRSGNETYLRALEEGSTMSGYSLDGSSKRFLPKLHSKSGHAASQSNP